MSTDKMITLEDLFQHELKDLYSAEKQLIEALPKMAKKASNASLKAAFEKHLTETKNQKQKLESIFSSMGIDGNGETCYAMKGLVKEGEDLMSHKADADVMDAGLIACAQRVEHYEIAGYGTARQYAQQLGHTQVMNTLSEILEEEKDTNEVLNDMAIQRINEKAMAPA